MFDVNPELKKKYGEVLEIALNIEQALEHLISTYVGFSGSYEEEKNGIKVTYLNSTSNKNIHTIQHLMIPRISLNEKINIFEEICKAEKVSDEQYFIIIKKIKKIKDIRNQVAHGKRFFDPFLSRIKNTNKRRKFRIFEEDLRNFFKKRIIH